jgi:LysR substrate binding domain
MDAQRSLVSAVPRAGSPPPFDPATSTRRFTIGAPDGASAVFLSPLLAELRHGAPGIDIRVRQLLPVPGEVAPERAWRSTWTELEARTMDLAIIPLDRTPLRFAKRLLHEEDFVLAMRAGHPFARDPSLARYCEAQHLVVSLAGDPYGFVDEPLARRKRSRRVALTAKVGPETVNAEHTQVANRRSPVVPRRRFFISSKVSRPETRRQQRPERRGEQNRIHVRNDDRRIVVRKLAQLLPAAPAGHDRLGRQAGHGSRDHAPAARHHQMRKRHRFGAQAFRIRSVLDVAASMDAPLLIEQRRADRELRVRRMSPPTRFARRFDQTLQHRGVDHQRPLIVP